MFLYQKCIFINKDIIKFDRQIKFIESISGNDIEKAVRIQEKIKNLHIAVLGVGGVGSYVAFGLAAMGVGKINLIDNDVIELSNVSRQMLYSENDTGKYKVDVAIEKLKAVNPETEFVAHKLFVDSHEKAKQFIQEQPDMLILSADTPRGYIAYIIDEVCHQYNVPFIIGAPTADKIIIGPLIVPGVTATLSDLIAPSIYKQKNIDDSVKFLNSRFIASVIDPYNAIAGKMVLAEAIKYLTGFLPTCVLGNSKVLDITNWQHVE